MVISNDIRARRIKNNLTIKELEQITGVGSATISNIERGNSIPRIDTAFILCKALKCSIIEAFWEEGKK